MIKTHTTFALALTLVACTPAAPARDANDGSDPSHAEASVLDAARKQPRLRLGHYATADGMQGFVLDRTGSVAKLKRDGEEAILELTAEEEFRGPTKVATTFRSPDGDLLLRIDRYGSIDLYQTVGTVPVARDADADPLGAPTVKGQWIAPKTPYDLAAAKYQAIAVRTRLKGFAPEDSGNLTKVAEAIEKADGSMFVHYTAPPGATARWRPVSPRIGDTEYSVGIGYYPSDTAFDPKAGGLQKYGAVVEPDLQFQRRGKILVATPKGYEPKNLAKGTPGLVWEVDGAEVVFVTLDGGRYHVNISGLELAKGEPLAVGLPAKTAWPAPLQHALVDAEGVTYLAKAGALPESAVTTIERHREAFAACAAAVWKEADREVESLKTSDLHWSTRAGRLEQLEKKYETKAQDTCRSHVAAFTQSLLDQIETRNQRRLAIWEKAKQR
ncbi:MAG: hypothetical protein KC731_24585 [Myxococcales bacterium]|nr:hypothetical protein [Myxococcales bacterium]